MLFSCHKSALLSAVSAAAKAASKNGVEVALMHVLLSLEGNTLTITGTDSQLTVRETLEVEGQKDGAVAILADLLEDTLNGCQTSKSHSVSVEVSDAMRVTIQSGAQVSYTLNARSAEAFPAIRTMDQPNSLTASGALLREISKKMAAVASATGGLNQYDEVFFESTGEALSACSTDSVRLAFIEIPKGSTGLSFLGKFTSLVPVKVFKTMSGLVRNEDTVNVAFSTDEVVFKFRTTELRGRLSDKRFPDFRNIMPKAQAVNAIIDTRAFTDALKGVMVTSKDSKFKVFVDFATDRITLTSTSPELGESKRDIEAAVEGVDDKGKRLAFNGRYLQDFLGVADHETVKWGVTSSSYPATMEPDLEGCGYRQVIMPITIG